jgi:hypothetical protein
MRVWNALTIGGELAIDDVNAVVTLRYDPVG